MPQVKNKLHFQILEIIVILCQQLFYEVAIVKYKQYFKGAVKSTTKCNEIKIMANFAPFDQS